MILKSSKKVHNTNKSKMADVREMRIFSAEQIVVPDELPEILKDFSKEVIRNNPPDIIKFSREYFTRKAAEDKTKRR